MVQWTTWLWMGELMEASRRTSFDFLDIVADDPRSLLICDDDVINRTILSNLFSDTFSITETQDGDECLMAVLSSPDAWAGILLDYQMERMDGLEVLRRLHRRGLTERIPVFLISAEATMEVVREAYQLGCMDVIEKPVVPFVVRRRVLSVAELFTARRRLSQTVLVQQNELIRRATEILKLNRGMIEALSQAIEFRNGESGAHVRRIHDITGILLRGTPLGDGLSEEDVEIISVAAIMHDVGKIAIPDAILGKPGKLTPEEFEIMKSHTVLGAQLLEDIPQLHSNDSYRYAVDIARHHHERWDGSGYPDGLRGDELSSWVQAVSIADVYDALRSERVYKPAYSREKALQMIVEGACGVFNPKLIETFNMVEPEVSLLYGTTRDGGLS